MDATLFLGMRLWQGAELWVNPEIDQGFGLSSTLGVAGFPSGEAYKVGAVGALCAHAARTSSGRPSISAATAQKVDGAANQFSGSQTANRLVITVGKFGVTDVFDTNKYAHDPRNDFMNWALIDTGTFDYAADAWGFTYGAAAEWYQGDWTVRGGIFDLSIVPNSIELDPRFAQFQWVGEIERRYELWGQPGKIAVTGFLSRGRMGSFADAIALGRGDRRLPPTSRGAPIHQPRRREPQSRAADHRTSSACSRAPASPTAISSLTSSPTSIAPWRRDLRSPASPGAGPTTRSGLAGVVNGITSVHQAYLNAGGLGILVGDGMLPHPAPEQIIETYYQLPVSFFKLTLDYQFIVNPAYNSDRGPASVVAARMHAQF